MLVLQSGIKIKHLEQTICIDFRLILSPNNKLETVKYALICTFRKTFSLYLFVSTEDMIKFYLLGLFLFVFAGVSAQVNVSISGRIYDAETSEELPFATVALYQDSLFISGTISGDDGRFILSGNFKGDYTVKISFIGYLPTQIPILIGELNTNFNLGKISLASSATELNEVTVKAQKSLVSSGNG